MAVAVSQIAQGEHFLNVTEFPELLLALQSRCVLEHRHQKKSLQS